MEDKYCYCMTCWGIFSIFRHWVTVVFKGRLAIGMSSEGSVVKSAAYIWGVSFLKSVSSAGWMCERWGAFLPWTCRWVSSSEIVADWWGTNLSLTPVYLLLFPHFSHPLSLSLSLSLSMSLSLCVWVSASVYESLSLCLWVSVSLSVSMSLFVYECVCVCVSHSLFTLPVSLFCGIFFQKFPASLVCS